MVDLFCGANISFQSNFTYNQFRDAFKKKKVNFGTLAQKGGGGQSKIPNVDQY